jgi:hypothetical protein
MAYPDEQNAEAYRERQYQGLGDTVQAAYADATGYAGTSRLRTMAETLEELFKYHPPTAEEVKAYAAINQAAKNFAYIVLDNCPYCADTKDAVRKIREARMTANAAIALRGVNI